ncbi:DUF1801 domain-containing protein [Gangjinia marincola]|uniref:DUF1801 domain-containing protein n=1 Tax=Gangjinia marincola TaxID=578463 RepID=A0ABP3XWZ3_9FLAO
MATKITSVEDYVKTLSADRKEVVENLCDLFKRNLPSGFEEQLSYGMIGFVVPKSIYPAGYHVNPDLPLPFINIASQKNYIAIYHNGLYADQELLEWFKRQYIRQVTRKLDMGKSCIRFKKMDQIPYQLLKELAQQMTADEWIKLYEKNIKK